MIVRFLNGTAQQQDWFREAFDRAWHMWIGAQSWDPFPRSGFSRLATRVEVEWVADPGQPAGTELATAQSTFDEYGMRARIEMHERLDDPSFEFYEGKKFYCETVVHELGHVMMGRLLDSEEKVERICELLGIPRSQWETGDWFDQGKEATAEIIKVATCDPALLAHPNRTNLQLNVNTSPGAAVSPSRPYTYNGRPVSVPPEWREFAEDIFEPSTTVWPFVVESGDLEFTGLHSSLPWFAGEIATYEGDFWLTYVGGAIFNNAKIANLPVADGWAIRRVATEGQLYDAHGHLCGANRTNIGFPSIMPPANTHVVIPAAIPQFTAGNLAPEGGPIGPFEWDRLAAGMFRMHVIFYAALAPSTLPASVPVTVSHPTRPTNPMFVAPPYEVIKALIPSEITAYGAAPGWRRRKERIL